MSPPKSPPKSPLDGESMNDNAALERLWLDAVEARQQGQTDDAREFYKAILDVDPRLAEPRLELGHMEIENGELEEGAEHVRLAVAALEAGGQWIDDIEPSVLLSFALNLLGEALFRQAEAIADADDRDRFEELWNEAAEIFARALRLDPDNADAKRNAFSVQRKDA
jgi:tetratricopeptide (TPR) repeat protein